jgi:steroid delta-isomerase-like uncharacterized protein
MDMAENKGVVRQFLQEVINKHDPAARPDLIAPGYVSHFGTMPPLDHESWEGLARAYFTAFPDLDLTIQDEISNGDRVAVRWTWTATHQGDFMGIPATGKRVSTSGMGMYRVVDGQIAEEWVVEDVAAVLQQLGAFGS